MLRNDRKVAKAILKLTNKNFDAICCFDWNHPSLSLAFTGSSESPSIELSLHPMQIFDTLTRFLDEKYISTNSPNPLGPEFDGLLYFRITDKLTHPFVFAFDSFTKKFWNGFLAGFASGIGSALIAWLLTRHL